MSDSQILDQALKQFHLETEHLEEVFQGLTQQYKSVEKKIEESDTQLYSKVMELDFTTGYLNAILDHISQGILFLDFQGIITTCNHAAEKILEIPAKELLFHSFWEKFRDDFFGFSLKKILQEKNSPILSYISIEVATGKKIELEVETTLVAMEQNAYNDLALSTLQKGNSTRGLLILFRNITEIRKLQEITQRNHRLKDLGEMAARLAHEIRNPLGGIKGYASLLEEDLKKQPDQHKMAAKIVEAADSLNCFVSAVLDYSRSYQPKIEMTDLVTFLKELLHLIEADPARMKNVQTHFKTSLTNLQAPIDHFLIRSALLNLMVNALQAMPNGGTLTLELSEENNEATILVKDTGIGISPENLEKLFTPFFTTKKWGSGFGLSEVHKVVEAHNGTINVASEVGHGTIFTIKIPLNIQ